MSLDWHLLNRRVRVRLPRVDRADKPCRDEIREADRPEYELWIGQLRLVRELCSINLILLRLDWLQSKIKGAWTMKTDLSSVDGGLCTSLVRCLIGASKHMAPSYTHTDRVRVTHPSPRLITLEDL